MTARARRRLIALGVVLAVFVLGAVVAVIAGRDPAVSVRQQFVAGTPEAGAPVELDTSLYLPQHTPAPAVLLAHGLGGTKASLAGQARSLAQAGFVVLTYTARGFGRSGGLIHLDSLDYEVPDAARLLDFLQARPEVLKRSGKPVLGVAGASYGGALALMLGATDPRILAVAADITWHDLTASLFPQGIYKKLWAGYLFAISMQSPAAAAVDPAIVASRIGCGRFAAELCAFYRAAGETGRLPAAGRALLARSSPAGVLDHMRAPTLLTQGEQDSLFPLSEADANARQIAAAGAPVQVRWRSGGHDAAGTDDSAVAGWQQSFFEHQLDGGKSADGSSGKPRFLLDDRGAAISATTGRRVSTTLRAEGGYPGIDGGARTATLTLAGPAQPISAPAGGAPAAVSSLPGLGSVLGTASELGVSGTAGLSTLPGQTAIFSTGALAEQRLIAGSSTVRLRVSAVAGNPREADLFVSLRDVAPDGTASLPAGLVNAVRVPLGAGLGDTTSTVQLPWVVDTVPAGHRLAVYVSTTDFGYAMPADARSYAVALDSPDLTVPALTTRTIRSGNLIWWPIAAVIVVLACAGFALVRSRRRRIGQPAPELADVPVAVLGLVKEYADGYRAVDDVSFEVRRGQVLGLLGPNGAGKTTTLRVLMGLIMPTAGTVRIFGDEVLPGAPVLASVGAFVEGPGLLPHLSGRDNLRLYWAASGRPEEEAEFETVLEIAGLGSSLDRRVKTYSHGMQQRLAIAQAMLGLPPVLVLDEPTNGLDPPQIAEMREVLHRYAATGRTVIISSHLLAEVEQTCSHVVVMARGRVVAAGSVAEVAGLGSEQLAVEDPAAAEEALRLVGIAARRVPARRALEEVFLDLVGERDV